MDFFLKSLSTGKCNETLVIREWLPSVLSLHHKIPWRYLFKLMAFMIFPESAEGGNKFKPQAFSGDCLWKWDKVNWVTNINEKSQKHDRKPLWQLFSLTRKLCNLKFWVKLILRLCQESFFLFIKSSFSFIESCKYFNSIYSRVELQSLPSNIDIFPWKSSTCLLAIRFCLKQKQFLRNSSLFPIFNSKLI